MASKPPIEPDTTTPLTEAEHAENERVIRAHFGRLRRRLAGWPLQRRYGQRRRPEVAPVGFRPDILHLVPNLLSGIVPMCRRPDCRRRRRCCFGMRPGDEIDLYARCAPCLMILPKGVRLLTPFIVMRRHTPAELRAPGLQKSEREIVALIEGEIEAMRNPPPPREECPDPLLAPGIARYRAMEPARRTPNVRPPKAGPRCRVL